MRSFPLALSSLPGATDLRAYWVTDQGRLIHAFKVALALVLAMGLCMRLELTPPRTAMVSVVIVMMHQQAGMVIARGFYRVVGMIVGSVVGLGLIACFAQQPVLFLACLALWIGLCVWGASYYRNYQSYAFVLAGYATAITAVPVWNNPYGVFDSVVYSLSEVALGVACASFVSAIILPQRVAPALLMAGQRHCTAFLAFLRKALSSDAADAAQMDAEQVHLLANRPMLEGLRSAAIFEDPELRLKNNLMIRLNQDFLDTNTGMYAIRKLRVRAMQQGRTAELGAIDQLLHELAAITPLSASGAPLSLDDIAAFQKRLKAFGADLPHRIAFHEIQLGTSDEYHRKAFFAAASSLHFFVIDLASYLENFVALRQPVVHHGGSYEDKVHVRRIINTANSVAAVSAGVRAMAAVLIVGALWIASGWNGGASGLVAVSIATALFAVMPNPAAATRQMLLGCLASIVVGFAFYFFVVPKLDGLTQLAACMAPVIMTGSYVNTFPKVAVIGLGFNIYFCFIGNITNPYVFDPPAFLDTGFAMLVGMATAAFTYAVIAPWGGGFATQGYLRQLRGLVARQASSAPLNDEQVLRFESYVRDFTLQMAAQPSVDMAAKKQLLDWSFAALEIGWSVIQIRMNTIQHQAELPKEWLERQRAWQSAIASLFTKPSSVSYGKALRETRRMLDDLPLPAVFDANHHAMIRFRMWALLHAVEMSLQDESVPLRPATESSA
jgi:uncharacterized membrane protein YccC